MRRLLIEAIVVVTLSVTVYPLSLADEGSPPDGSWDGYVEDQDVVVSGSVSTDSVKDRPSDSPGGGRDWKYQWLLACMQNRPGAPMTDCANALRCPRSDQLLWTLWGSPASVDDWVALTVECRSDRPPNAPRPTLTPGRVLEAVRRIGLPSLEVQIQPDTATLVNFDTIFYAEPVTFERTVRLLGFSVDVRAEPSSYQWIFGDGQVDSTEKPGAPYPAKDITHKYVDAHVTVHPRVDVTYQVQYRVDGGAWQALDETLTAQGPTTTLRIKEATPVLSGGE